MVSGAHWLNCPKQKPAAIEKWCSCGYKFVVIWNEHISRRSPLVINSADNMNFLSKTAESWLKSLCMQLKTIGPSHMNSHGVSDIQWVKTKTCSIALELSFCSDFPVFVWGDTMCMKPFNVKETMNLCIFSSSCGAVRRPGFTGSCEWTQFGEKPDCISNQKGTRQTEKHQWHTVNCSMCQ